MPKIRALHRMTDGPWYRTAALSLLSGLPAHGFLRQKKAFADICLFAPDHALLHLLSMISKQSSKLDCTGWFVQPSQGCVSIAQYQRDGGPYLSSNQKTKAAVASKSA